MITFLYVIDPVIQLHTYFFIQFLFKLDKKIKKYAFVLSFIITYYFYQHSDFFFMWI